MKSSSLILVALLALAACATTGEGAKTDKDGVRTLATPDTMVTLAVTMPDGSVNEIIVADGDFGTVKIDEAHTFSCTPKIAGPDKVEVQVAELEMGDKPKWKPLETVMVAVNAPVSTTKTSPALKLALESIKKSH